MIPPDVKNLLLDAGNTEVAFFMPCDTCLGGGKVPSCARGGPYGIDRNTLEPCRRCYRGTGKKLVKVPLAEVVTTIQNIGR